MNAKSVGYWITTALSAFAFASGGVMDLLHGKEMVDGMAHLGYPPYFMSILGTWKVAAAIAVLAPRFPRLKRGMGLRGDVLRPDGCGGVTRGVGRSRCEDR